MSFQERSNRFWVSTCCTNRSGSSTSVGSALDRHGEGVSRESGRRSVESTSVRCPARAPRYGRASSRRGLADTALAGEEDGPQGQPSDSTRLLSPRSAVSMMTFSAFRFSIPIIGMATSTARE